MTGNQRTALLIGSLGVIGYALLSQRRQPAAPSAQAQPSAAAVRQAEIARWQAMQAQADARARWYAAQYAAQTAAQVPEAIEPTTEDITQAIVDHTAKAAAYSSRGRLAGFW